MQLVLPELRQHELHSGARTEIAGRPGEGRGAAPRLGAPGGCRPFAPGLPAPATPRPRWLPTATRAAGMAAIAVSWGAATREALVSARPDALVDTVEQLQALLLP